MGDLPLNELQTSGDALVSSSAIQRHYDYLTPKYVRFWGEHIHHGFWQGGESPRQAQESLIERLARKAGIPEGATVLDVGCGVGGSSLWLAQHRHCEVVGITISPVQVDLARQRAAAAGLDARVRFERFDANHLEAFPGKFDAVWIIECSEHIFDKAQFFRNIAALLQPGGRLALCAWLKAQPVANPAHERLVQEVCEGMLCPALATLDDYKCWLEKSGFHQIKGDDITAHTARTWDICCQTLHRPEIKAFLYFSDAETRRFADAFRAIQRAYAEGAMAYGMFSAIVR